MSGEHPIALVNHEVVHALEDLLARAKRGEVHAFAIATEAHGRAVGTQIVGDVDKPRLLGALRILEHRVMQGVELP